MKALSLLQPWASLVVIGVKKIETRSWRTDYHGKLLIHASQGKAGAIFARDLPFKKYIPDFYSLPFGAIIGEVILVDVIAIGKLALSDPLIEKLTLEEKAFGDYRPGRYAWIMEDAQKLKFPIPRRGSLHLWNTEI